MNPLLLTDFYKVSHPFQYPEGTTLVYSNMTARKSRMPGVDGIIFFGLQYFCIKYLQRYFDDHFFNVNLDDVMHKYKRRIRTSLGGDLPSYEHIEKLHKLGYLPLRIKAVKEGSFVPIRQPFLTIENTLPEFYWLTNFVETLMSAMLWQPITSATIAREYRIILEHAAESTGGSPEFVSWQGHDFSFRGMSSLESAELSGMGHLLFFTGTDTIPAIDALERYYLADADTELIGGSVAATEHSVMCAGGNESEIDTFRRLLTIYPTGILSVVSDTWDLWKVCTEYLVELKELILSRDGKLVIRPDSGDPCDIVCGLNTSPKEYVMYDAALPSYKGVVEILWDIFGGTVNAAGYKVLNPKIGCIYGDGITLSRATEICARLKMKGFSSDNIVFGIGSYTYQYNTRDTFGFAVKATYVEINGVGVEIYKDPVTDDGTKKSAKGLICIDQDGSWRDCVTREEEEKSMMTTVFENGQMRYLASLEQIRYRAKQTIPHKVEI